MENVQEDSKVILKRDKEEQAQRRQRTKSPATKTRS